LEGRNGKSIKKARALRAFLSSPGAQSACSSRRLWRGPYQSIKNVERGVTDPRLSTAMAIKTAPEKAGVQFLDQSDTARGPSVALSAPT